MIAVKLSQKGSTHRHLTEAGELNLPPISVFGFSDALQVHCRPNTECSSLDVAHFFFEVANLSQSPIVENNNKMLMCFETI